MPKLIITNPDGTTVKYGLNGRNFTIGRAETNDIVLPGGSSSNHHAVIKQTDSGDFSITDLDSTNHTRINHQIIQTGVLRNGDVVQFGDIVGSYESEFTAPVRTEDQPTQAYVSAPPAAAPPQIVAPPTPQPQQRAAGPVMGRQPFPGGRAAPSGGTVGAADGCFAILMVGLLSLFAFIGGAWARHSSEHNGEGLSTWVKGIMQDRQEAQQDAAAPKAK
jgi:hypothetical protein